MREYCIQDKHDRVYIEMMLFSPKTVYQTREMFSHENAIIKYIISHLKHFY